MNVSWMEAHLPVMGDGVTPYLFQGPTFDPADLWNPAESLNAAKINETVKGTAIRDLVELVGGMHPGDEVQVRAADGFRKRLGYANVYAPPSRQGPPVLAWWNARNGYAWPESMRLFFLADTSSNAAGLHVFGNEDMRQCLAPAYWHYFYSDGVNFPSAAGLSVATVARLEVFPAPRALAVPDGAGIPTDTNADGLYNDVNGNGRRTSRTSCSTSTGWPGSARTSPSRSSITTATAGSTSPTWSPSSTRSDRVKLIKLI